MLGGLRLRISGLWATDRLQELRQADWLLVLLTLALMAMFWWLVLIVYGCELCGRGLEAD